MAVGKVNRSIAKRRKGKSKKSEFAFSSPEVKQISVVGDFNHWDPKAHPMKKDRDGMWKITVSLEPGRYEYRFLADGKWENDWLCAGCILNDYGTFNCVRIIEE